MYSKKNTVQNRTRLSIDVDPKEHQKIKLFATLQGISIKDYVLACIRERLEKEKEIVREVIYHSRRTMHRK